MRKSCLLLFLSILIFSFSIPPVSAQITEFDCKGYSIEVNVNLPVNSEIAYQVMTGDISGWWDHSLSENPYKYYIEAKPGGGFYEIFDESGDGARHAVVTYAKKGDMLRFEGPLGLAGIALNFVTTWKYTDTDSGCTINCLVNTSGQIEEGLAGVVENVWKHFLHEQLKPYIESGKYLEDKPELKDK